MFRITKYFRPGLFIFIASIVAFFSFHQFQKDTFTALTPEEIAQQDKNIEYETFLSVEIPEGKTVKQFCDEWYAYKKKKNHPVFFYFQIEHTGDNKQKLVTFWCQPFFDALNAFSDSLKKNTTAANP